jgi:AraC-like DNA-binding protein
MPSSAVRKFADADAYAAWIRGAVADLTVTRSGDFNAKLTRIDLHHLWMQRYSDSLPRILDLRNLTEGRSYIIFRRRPGPSLVQSGIEVRSSAILRFGQAREFYQRSAGAANFGTMSLPIGEMEAIGVDPTPPLDATLVNSPPEALASLRRVHAAAGRLAEDAPEIIANPDAARGLEQALIEAFVECLDHRHEHPDRSAQGQHAIVMRRFRRVLEENPEQPIYIPEICKAIRVAERTLRVCCHEHLGMSPKRYLVLRRMHLARRALRAAAPEATSVTDVAMRYGFWQLGRFAGEYRSLFGETPSATFHRRPG